MIQRTQEVFAALYARTHLALLRYVLTLIPDRNQAEEIVQETACQLFQKFDQYDPGQPFWPWARKFAYYEVLKHRKKQALKRKYFSDDLVELLAQERDQHEDWLETRRQALQECLGRLDSHARQMVLDRYGGNLSVTELAQRQGKSPNALSLAMHRIRQVLSECVRRTLGEEGWTR